MRWIWIIIWLLILLVQIALYGVRTTLVRPVSEISIGQEQGYLDLARETNRMWGMLLDVPGDTSSTGEGVVPTGDLMEREEWLMQLHELQVKLKETNGLVELVDDLENWLQLQRKSHGQLSSLDVNRFLKNLHGWLSSVCESKEGLSLQGVRLEPGAETKFPDLYFEFEGRPIPIGNSLLAASQSKVCWRVEEIEMHRDDISDTWWIQGSCAYSGEGH